MSTTNRPAQSTEAKTVYTRVSHAGHYGNSGAGHDLERWDVTSPTVCRTSEIPSDAELSYGYLDIDRAQHWVFVRRAALSSLPTCVTCKAVS